MSPERGIYRGQATLRADPRSGADGDAVRAEQFNDHAVGYQLSFSKALT